MSELQNYDMVYAVTQGAINSMMLNYLDNIKDEDRKIEAYGIASFFSTTYTEDTSKANICLEGELARSSDLDENFNILELYTDNIQKVIYNVPIKNAVLKSLVNEEKVESKLLIVKMYVNFTKDKIEKEKLSKEILEKLGNIDENMFSIEQLILDMNTAKLNKIGGVEGIGKAGEMINELLSNYLKKLQKKNQVIFGVTLTRHQTSTIEKPTYQPTSVDFCISPHTVRDENGKRIEAKENRDLDTLNYLIMTQGHTPPTYHPKELNFDWTRDVSEHGKTFINRELFVDSIFNSLKPIVDYFSIVLKLNMEDKNLNFVKPSDNYPTTDDYIVMSVNEPMKKITPFNASNGKIIDYKYKTTTMEKKKGILGVESKVMFAIYDFNLDVFIKDDYVLCEGSIVMYGRWMHADFFEVWFGNPDRILPKSTYTFSFKIQPKFNVVNSYIMKYDIKDYKFSDKPSIENHDDSLFNWFFSNIDENMFDVKNKVKDIATNDIPNFLNNSIKDTGKFVFPGGKTFSFKNGSFTNEKNLSATITYEL